jgi:hypothetical protein
MTIKSMFCRCAYATISDAAARPSFHLNLRIVLFGYIPHYMKNMKAGVEMLGERKRGLESLSGVFREIGRSKDLVQRKGSLSGHGSSFLTQLYPLLD